MQNWSDYDALFDHKPNTAWRLDASTDYLSCDASPELIAEFSKMHPVKIIIIVRDPVQRIVSEFQHTRRAHMQTENLSQSVAAEPARIARNWHPLFHHVKRSTYASKIAKWRELFGDNLLIVDFHEFIVENESLDTITDFLGIPPVIEEAVSTHLNRSFTPRSEVLSRALKSTKLKTVSRLLVPRPLRPLVWRTVSKANQAQYRPSMTELNQLRALLADEIAACEADPAIPTDHWHMARGDKARQGVSTGSGLGADDRS